MANIKWTNSLSSIGLQKLVQEANEINRLSGERREKIAEAIVAVAQKNPALTNPADFLLELVEALAPMPEAIRKMHDTTKVIDKMASHTVERVDDKITLTFGIDNSADEQAIHLSQPLQKMITPMIKQTRAKAIEYTKLRKNVARELLDELGIAYKLKSGHTNHITFEEPTLIESIDRIIRSEDKQQAAEALLTTFPVHFLERPQADKTLAEPRIRDKSAVTMGRGPVARFRSGKMPNAPFTYSDEEKHR